MDALRLFSLSAVIGAMGLPLYLHLPKFANAELGISLGILGAILIGLRAVDMVQDPFIGRMLDQFPKANRVIAMLATLFVVLGFLGVFAIRVDAGQMLVFILSTVLLFSGYSALYIMLYKTSAQMSLPDPARIREMGILFGVIVGAVLPMILAGSYPAFAIVLSVLMIGVAIFVRQIWISDLHSQKVIGLRDLQKIGGGQILLLLFLNTLPVAMTSTLFLFFVDEVLALGDYAGIFLGVFFLGALIGVMLTSLLEPLFDTKKLLMANILGAILVFIWAFFLSEGAAFAFFTICVLSGAFLGAELYILPLVFSRLLKSEGLKMGAAFGVWTFLNKFGLAFAAAIVLPIIAVSGFETGAQNTRLQLTILAFCYAALPCVIKLMALFILNRTPKEIFQ